MTKPCHCLILALTAPSLLHPAELAAHGIRAWSAPTFAAAQALLRQWRFDVVLVDAGPGSLSAEVLTKLRRLGTPAATPLLLWADADTDPATLLRVLRSGVADWLPKPSGVALLALKLLRLAAPALAAPPPPGVALQIGPLSLLPQRGVALAHGLPLDLTPGEFALLWLLAARADQVLSRQAIACAMSGADRATPGRVIDNQVCRIRRQMLRLGLTDPVVRTVHGRGYSLARATSQAVESLSRPHIAAHAAQDLQRGFEDREIA